MIPSSVLGANRLRKNIFIGDDETVAPREAATGPSPPSSSGQLQVTSASDMALQPREHCGGPVGDRLRPVSSGTAARAHCAVERLSRPGREIRGRTTAAEVRKHGPGGSSNSLPPVASIADGVASRTTYLQHISLLGLFQTLALRAGSSPSPDASLTPRRPDSRIGADGHRPNHCADERTLVVPLSMSSLRKGNSLRHALPHPWIRVRGENDRR